MHKVKNTSRINGYKMKNKTVPPSSDFQRKPLVTISYVYFPLYSLHIQSHSLFFPLTMVPPLPSLFLLTMS